MKRGNSKVVMNVKIELNNTLNKNLLRGTVPRIISTVISALHTTVRSLSDWKCY